MQKPSMFINTMLLLLLFWFLFVWIPWIQIFLMIGGGSSVWKVDIKPPSSCPYVIGCIIMPFTYIIVSNPITYDIISPLCLHHPQLYHNPYGCTESSCIPSITWVVIYYATLLWWFLSYSLAGLLQPLPSSPLMEYVCPSNTIVPGIPPIMIYILASTASRTTKIIWGLQCFSLPCQ